MNQSICNASVGVLLTLVLCVFAGLSTGCGTIDANGFVGLETCDILNCDGLFFAKLADDHIDDADDHDDGDDDHVDVADDHDDGDDDHVDVADDHDDGVDDHLGGVDDDEAEESDDHTHG